MVPVEMAMEPTEESYPQKYLKCPWCGGDVDVMMSKSPEGDTVYLEFCECGWEYDPRSSGDMER